MDDAANPGTPSDPSPSDRTPVDPTADATTTPTAPRGRRRWLRVVGLTGVTALALIGAVAIGAVLVGGPRLAADRDRDAHAGPQGGPRERVAMVPARASAERMGRAYASGHRDGVRSAEHRADRSEQREARLSELATALDLDVVELTEAVDALHASRDAERAALREELADATPEERRAAMQTAMRASRDQMRELLIGLGADEDAVDTLLAEHAGRGGRAGMMAGRVH